MGVTLLDARRHGERHRPAGEHGGHAVRVIDEKSRLPGNVRLRKGEAGLSRPSVVNVTQLSTIDRQQLGHRLGTLSNLGQSSCDLAVGGQ
jgi:mRNA-degrading endonuclease toxin of MazEF toxin-antitoxin module